MSELTPLERAIAVAVFCAVIRGLIAAHQQHRAQQREAGKL